jgi:hypothetical protein
VRAVQILVAVLLAVIAGGCGGGTPEPRLGRLTAAELLASDTIVAARTGSVRLYGEGEADGRRYRIARVSLLDAVSIQGSLRGAAEFTVYVPAAGSAESREVVDSILPAEGQRRVFFLRWDGPQLRSARDGDSYSFPAASEAGTFQNRPAEPVSLTVVRLLLVSSSDKIQPPYPHSIGRVAEFVGVPLIGRAKTLRVLEEALAGPDRETQARTCESLLYLTGLPHSCLKQHVKRSGEIDDEGVRNAVQAQRESFALLRKPEVARAAVMARCLENAPVALHKSIDPREDCREFAEAALSVSSADWLQR